jgi:hypothetical protein
LDDVQPTGGLWMSQSDMAALFGTTTQNITIRIKALYDRGVLAPHSTRRRGVQVCMEGKRQVRREVFIYNLDVIVAIGRGVRGRQGEAFRRRWDEVDDVPAVREPDATMPAWIDHMERADA